MKEKGPTAGGAFSDDTISTAGVLDCIGRIPTDLVDREGRGGELVE
jgi:hypothetical protein